MDAPLRNCLKCGTEFDPGKTRRQYCRADCQTKAENERRPGKSADSATAKVIAAKCSRRCTNCKHEGGQLRAFWWDDFDRADLVMETAMLLCSKCWGKFNRSKVYQDGMVRGWEAKADPPKRVEV